MPDGACCWPRADGVTYLAIGDRQITVGMSGLDLVFEQLFLLEKTPENVTDEELVELARNYNYIPDKGSIMTVYAVALRKAYAAFLSRRAQKPS